MTSLPLDVYGAAFRLELYCRWSTISVPLLCSHSWQFLLAWFRCLHQKQRFGRRSFLNWTQCFGPFSSVITLPRHKSRVISIITRTRMKCPPSSVTAFADFYTSPMMSQMFFCHFLCHVPNWDIMDLNPEYRFWKNQVTNWTICIVPLQHHQMFIENPWLIFENSVYMIGVIKYKQNSVIILVLDSEPVCRSPQLFESSRHGLHI